MTEKTGKDLEGNGRGMFKVICRHSPGGTKENHEENNQYDRPPGWDLKPQPNKNTIYQVLALVCSLPGNTVMYCSTHYLVIL